MVDAPENGIRKKSPGIKPKQGEDGKIRNRVLVGQATVGWHQ